MGLSRRGDGNLKKRKKIFFVIPYNQDISIRSAYEIILYYCLIKHVFIQEYFFNLKLIVMSFGNNYGT